MSAAVDAIRWWALEAPDRPAVEIRSEQLTYAELDRWTDRIAWRLRHQGVEPGDRVGIVGENCFEWLASGVGLLKAGAVPFLINARFVAPEVAHLIRDAQPSAVISGLAHLGVVTAASADAGVTVGLIDFGTVAADRTGAGGPAFPAVETEPEAPLVIVYTSGSSGRPKGVVITHRAHGEMLREWSLQARGFRLGMKWLCALPLAGMPSFVWGSLVTLINGGTIHLLSTFDAESVIEAIDRADITVCTGVPTIWERVARSERFPSLRVETVEHLHTGGARIADETMQAWAARGVLIQQTYGLTEAGGSVTITPRSRALDKAHTVGRGGVFSRLKVLRPDGTECAPEEPGEIVIRNSYRSAGYWGGPGNLVPLDLTDDGWLRTGDLGRMDDEGFLTFIDRMKDLIISGGLNISPLEIENAIRTVRGVEEVAVVPVSHPTFGEVPGALIYAPAGVDRNLIDDACRDELASYKRPRHVVFSTEPLPRLAGGKMAKRQIRDAYADLLVLADSTPDVHH